MHQHLKVKDLVAAAYAAVPTLPPAEAKLMREVATRLSVTFTTLTESLELRKTLKDERDDLNQQVVNLAVENAVLKQVPAKNSERMLLALDAFQTHGKTRPDVGMQQAFTTLLNVETPATNTFLANIQAQGVEKFAANEREWAALWEKYGVTDGSVSRCLIVAQDADKFAAGLRKAEGK